MVKIDRRIRRTRRLLGEALIELIQNKSFERITIRDITEAADIGYATFFRHFDNKEELLSEQIADIIRQLHSGVGDHGDDYFSREGTRFFEHVQENELLYRGLLSGNVSSMVTRRLKDTLALIIHGRVEEHLQDTELRVPLALVVNHIAAATLELAAWWLDKGKPYSPADMGTYYDIIVIQATWYAILPSGLEGHSRITKRE